MTIDADLVQKTDTQPGYSNQAMLIHHSALLREVQWKEGGGQESKKVDHIVDYSNLKPNYLGKNTFLIKFLNVKILTVC